ncbi:blastoderm-specific protein 25D [Galleria mellonella]|uniref:Blastoderm-specific protein 25D n=1 Tax=Galleria mellonella TaxID=7137 RepID=A0ABM3MU30_GALME|nr:blastoderm-specific protein 25D [Galleria mellonella]
MPHMGSLAMDSVCMNHYEKQLYTVFKTFDVDNEEALDRSAVLKLCDALQLEDRGSALVDTLFERCSERVTFTQFRNGLLSVLGGGETTPSSSPKHIATDTSQTLASTAPSSATVVPVSSHSDDDSSGREVAPKFVFGSKKYGRRSRPQRSSAMSDDTHTPRAASVSRLDSDNKRARSSQRMKCRRSASAMDNRNHELNYDDETTHGDFEHDRRIDCEQALALCCELRMDGIDRRLIERIFEESPSAETTVGEFFERLNVSLTSSIEGAQDTSTATPLNSDYVIDHETGIPSMLVIEAWENAGVPRPRRLMLELGFTSSVVRPPDIEHALEDEIRALPEPLDDRRDAHTMLLVAALELARLRLKFAKQRADVTAAERDKLRADVAEANRRACLLAQDVDESHARMEAELAANVRRAESKHAEAAKIAAAEIAAERERAAAIKVLQEAELARRAENEARLRTEIEVQTSRILELETRAATAENRASLAEREAIRLASELTEATASLNRKQGAVDAGVEDASATELAARLDDLRRENKLLRDRNDELCCALEARAREGEVPPVAYGDLSAELGSLLTSQHAEECDSSPTSIDQKVIGHTEATRRLRSIFDSVQAMPSPAKNECQSCSTLEAVIAGIQMKVRELSDCVILMEEAEMPLYATTEASVQTEPLSELTSNTKSEGVNLIKEMDTLKEQLAEAERRHNDEKQKQSELIKELETSLEQMKSEYDKCEEYWNNKLEEERDMYNEEQRLGDERLAELVAKISEYERQFAPAGGTLPTIEERCGLEAQVADLEEEFATYRKTKEEELRVRDSEIARLTEQIEALQRRVEAASGPEGRRRRGGGSGGSGSGGGGGCGGGGAACSCASLAERCRRLAAERGAGAREAAALRARAARAEGLARRLHARLAAADLLVKDLYVENCHLAHRRPL